MPDFELRSSTIIGNINFYSSNAFSQVISSNPYILPNNSPVRLTIPPSTRITYSYSTHDHTDFIVDYSAGWQIAIDNIIERNFLNEPLDEQAKLW